MAKTYASKAAANNARAPLLRSSCQIVSFLGLGLLAAGSVGTGAWAQAQPSYAPGTVYDAPSSVPLPTDAGRAAHTNLKILVIPGTPAAGGAAPQQAPAPQVGPPLAGYHYETPGSIACVYQLVTATVAGCDSNANTKVLATGGNAIAIVDAYDYTTALNDLKVFSSQFGLPPPTASNFQVVKVGTVPTAKGTGWDVEESLDIEYAHGLAPKAFIYLVEAQSNSYTNMLAAVDKAASLVAAKGGGEVSMSWGGSEFSGETTYDTHFKLPKVVYFASAGDGPGTLYPAASPFVVAVGGTGFSRKPSTGVFQAEVGWASTGGGASLYEARPSYQPSSIGTMRGTPDIAALADPTTGVWVYNTVSAGGWVIVGGTSAAAPIAAAITNSAGTFRTSTAVELGIIYGTLGTTGHGWTDIKLGYCGPYDGYLVGTGWDFCTGVGSPLGLSASYKALVSALSSQ